MTGSENFSRTEPQSFVERYPGLQVLSSDPENAEIASRSDLQRLLTPKEDHYVRNHHPTPRLDESDWTVSLTGMVTETAELSMDELREDYPTESIPHTMQCSGNGRTFFEPDAGGHQWTTGAVATAVWRVTPVREVLEAHGVDTDAGWVAVMGGEAPEDGDVFCRSIPMAKMLDDCLLAYEMNGAPLSDDHGFPVRLLVPGWFGNNCVKWVSRIHTMDSMIAGEEWNGENGGPDYTRWQQFRYRIIPEQDDVPTAHTSLETTETHEQLTSEAIDNAYLYDQLVTSLITAPAENAVRDPAEPIEITGMTWAGDDPVECVEVSTDGGETWADADLFEPALGRYAWRRFRYLWYPSSESGDHLIVSRATSERGRRQPATISAPEAGLRGIEDDEFPWNKRGYASNAYQPYGVTVHLENES